HQSVFTLFGKYSKLESVILVAPISKSSNLFKSFSGFKEPLKRLNFFSLVLRLQLPTHNNSKLVNLLNFDKSCSGKSLSDNFNFSNFFGFGQLVIFSKSSSSLWRASICHNLFKPVNFRSVILLFSQLKIFSKRQLLRSRNSKTSRLYILLI